MASRRFIIRPRLLHFVACENVQIRGVTFRNSGSWTLSFLECRDLVLDGFRIESRENPDIEKPRYADAKGRNNDGVDLIDCQQVRMANCFINSGDDSIVLKSWSPDGVCRDITIANCVVSSNASGIKIGTESAGAFEDIVVQNCTVFDTRCEGLAVLTVDGARIERVSFSNISPAQHQGRRHSRATGRAQPHLPQGRRGEEGLAQGRDVLPDSGHAHLQPGQRDFGHARPDPSRTSSCATSTSNSPAAARRPTRSAACRKTWPAIRASNSSARFPPTASSCAMRKAS